MTSIQACEIPPNALLRPYAERGFADAYTTVLPGLVSHAAFVEAFYSTPLFGLERWLLKWFAGRPSTHEDARRLAQGEASSFAAWQVESRTPDQLLLSDFTGRTRSWLMVATADSTSSAPCTSLYFGSAVLRRKAEGSNSASMGFGFHALLGFHRLYSRRLLRAASARLRASN